MSVTRYHGYSSNTTYPTPATLFGRLDREFAFDLDVCATENNAKCARFYSPEDDGLSKAWAPNVCWMNPPYGKEIRTWMEKAWTESQQGATVVCLIPSRTDTSWWHEFAMNGEIRFLRGRISFSGDRRKRAPFPSAVVIFRGRLP